MDTLHLIVAFLLVDGRQNEATFGMMNDEGVFPRLVELIHLRKDDNLGLHRMLLELLYEMSRIQRLRTEDLSKNCCYKSTLPSRDLIERLVSVEDDFIFYLFNLVEGVSDDVNDPYNYSIIRVLVSSASSRGLTIPSLNPYSSSS